MALRRRPEPEEDQPQSGFYRKFVKYFSLIMGLIYLSFGIFIMAIEIPATSISPTFKYILGTILLLYGVMRLVRAYQQFFRSRYNRD